MISGVALILQFRTGFLQSALGPTRLCLTCVAYLYRPTYETDTLIVNRGALRDDIGLMSLPICASSPPLYFRIAPTNYRAFLVDKLATFMFSMSTILGFKYLRC